MKTSISMATFLLAGAGAAGAGAAVPAPFQGSDTLFNVTRDVITAIAVNDPSIGPAASYVGGGSGNGQSAMVSNTQQHIAPMSRMMNSGNSLCSFNGGTNGSTATEAVGLIIGLDAVDVLTSTAALAGNGSDGRTCDAPAVDGGATGNGLVYNAAKGNTQGFANYKQVLALVTAAWIHRRQHDPGLRKRQAHDGRQRLGRSLRECLRQRRLGHLQRRHPRRKAVARVPP